MKNSIKTKFERRELKYLVTREQRDALLCVADGRLKPDSFGRSTVCSIYFDTPEHLLIRRSLESPVYKEKLRVRSYGTPGEKDKVFAEIKKKYKGVVYKRRVTLTERDAYGWLCLGGAPPEKTQITSEIDYMFKLYSGLSPSVFISASRTAFFGAEDSELRITFDDSILWRADRLRLTEGVFGEQLLPSGLSLMELKLTSPAPLWLAHALSENGIYKTSFSKYGKAYAVMMQRGETRAERSVCCA